MQLGKRKHVDMLIDGAGDKFTIMDSKVFPDGSEVKFLKQGTFGWNGSFKFQKGEILEPTTKTKKINYYYAPLAAVKESRTVENYENPIVRNIAKLIIAYKNISILSKSLAQHGLKSETLIGESDAEVIRQIDLLARLGRATNQKWTEVGGGISSSPRGSEEEEFNQ